MLVLCFFFFSSRRRHTRSLCDWSSDVCSSDLPRQERVHVLHAHDQVVSGLRGGRGLGSELLREGLELELLEEGMGGVAEIGRASCRERGEISGVAVSLKKKKKRKVEG